MHILSFFNLAQTSKAKRLKKLRSNNVEPVLGTLVNFLGMRRVHTKGVGLADKCLTMAAIAYNLKKLLKWEDKKRQADAKALLQSMNSVFLMPMGSIDALGCYYSLAFKKHSSKLVSFLNHCYIK